MEPLINILINSTRKSGISTYVDYFTTAKFAFYNAQDGYENCSPTYGHWTLYKNIQERLKKHNYQNMANPNKFTVVSIPFAFSPAIGKFAINAKRINDIEKYKYKGTQIYNLKAILDDETLKTIQIQDQSSAIWRYVYPKNWQAESPIIKEYRKRVYRFVSSESIQVTLMLRGNRMDWTDMTLTNDFHLKILGIGEDTIKYLDFSHVPPIQNTEDFMQMSLMRCVGTDLNKLQIIIKTINHQIRKYRTNKVFWSQVLMNFSKDFNLPLESVEDFYHTKEAFIRKKQIDQGYFDNGVIAD